MEGVETQARFDTFPIESTCHHVEERSTNTDLSFVGGTTMPSVMQRIGTPNPRHNLDNAYRSHLENVDPELSKYNETIRKRSVEEIYQQELQPAFEAFNTRQKRKDRRLDVKWGVSTAIEYQRAVDAKARASKNNIDQKGRPPIREIVWQFGNPEQGYGSANQTDESRQRIKKMLLRCQEKAEARYPQFAWGDLLFHADEVSMDANDQEHGSLHLHSSFTPLCFKNKQGPDVQVAFERCLQEMGFQSFADWKHDLDSIMEEVLHEYGMERTYMDNHEKHQDSSEWHRQQAEIRRTKAMRMEADKAEEQYARMRVAIAREQVDLQAGIQAFGMASIEEVISNPEGIYSNVLFLMAECDDDRFAELDREGRELKKKMLHTALRDTPVSRDLQQLVDDARRGRARSLSWQERQDMWNLYSEMSQGFWEFRNDLMSRYSAEINAGYKNRQSARQSYWDAQAFLRESRGLISMIIGIIWMISAKALIEKLDADLRELRLQRGVLIQNTATFKEYSNAYREELKAGKIPFIGCMNTMADMVRSLDREAAAFQQKIPVKNRDFVR